MLEFRHTTAVPNDVRRAYRLEYMTIGWNAAEAVLALTFGLLAGSLALTAFGIDSVIEVFSAGVVLVELGGHGGHDHEGSEARFLRLIGASFFLLAPYVLIEATWDLINQSRPHES